MRSLTVALVSMSAAAVIAFAAAPANAAIIINITDSAGNVDVSVSGSLDLTGAAFDHFQPYNTGIIPGGSNWYIASGTTPGMDWYLLTSVTLPFGTSTIFFSPPTSTSGDAFSIWGFGGGTPLVGVATGYVSGSTISSQMQFASQSIAGLTLIPGTYPFSIPNDTITLNIGGGEAVPEPATLVLVGSGLLGLAARRRRRS